MSLSDVSRLKELIQLNTVKDEWINDSKIVVSPLGDFLVVASPTAAAFYLKKYINKNSPEFQLTQIHRPSSFESSAGVIESCGLITAIYYLPVRLETQRGSHDLWHCVIIGYSSGVVEFVSESGQILASRQLCESPVVKFRTLGTVTNNNQPVTSSIGSCLIPKLSDLLVVYRSSIFSISGTVLVSTLIKNRKTLSLQNSSVPSKFQCKKFTIQDQEIVDIAAVSMSTFHLFDQLNIMSMNHSLLNEDHLKSLSSLVKFISVGQSPFIHFSTPNRFESQNVHELAHNMVSTVKTGIYRVAAGLWWGSPTSGTNVNNAAEEIPPDTEQRLQSLHSFKDLSKSALTIEASPGGRYSAVSDCHHRVIIQDNFLGTVIHVLKGYHHAQIGWITTSWEGRKEAPDQAPSSDQEFAVLLVIYLPRRGILEIWSPEQMNRIIEFPVGKIGRLLHSSDATLDASSRLSSTIRIFETGFLNPCGQIRKIYVPLHAVTSKSTSHDRTLHKQLKSLLQQDNLSEDVIHRLTEIVLASKEINGKLRMISDVFQADHLSAQSCRDILTSVSEQLSECSVATRHCDRYFRLLDLFEFLTSDVERDNATELVWSTQENELVEFIKAESEITEKKDLTEDMSVAELSSCFSHDKETSDLIGNDTSIDTLKVAETKFANQSSLLKFCIRLAKKCEFDFGSVKSSLITARIDGNLLEVFLQSLIGAKVDDLLSLGPAGQVLLFRLAFELNTSDGGNPALIHRGRKILLKSNITLSALIVVTTWRKFLKEYHSPTYAAEWDLILNHLQSYLKIRSARKRYLSLKTIEDHAYDNAFMSGNGRIAEIVAGWLAETEAPADLIENFLVDCQVDFPLSCLPETISAHLCWQQFQAWSRSHSDLTRLEDALRHLGLVKRLSVRQKLASLAWNTFVSKPIKDSISLTEFRSKTRCQRELGMPEELVPNFLRMATKILRVILDDTEVEIAAEDGQPYDVLNPNVVPVEHLMDRVTKIRLPDDDVISIQFQFTFIADAIWNFDLDNVKPLSMFNSQESNMFFQNASTLSMSSTFRIFMDEHSRGVRNARRRFIEAASDGVVHCIHHSAEANDGLDLGPYHEWNSNLLLLANMWHLGEKLREAQIVSLYRAGYDALGEEFFHALHEDERRVTGVKLLRVCLLRIAAFIHFDDDRERRVAALHRDLISKLSTIKSEATGVGGVIEVPLKATSDLLVTITNLNLDEENLQLAYTCLAVVQMFRKE